MVLAHIPEQATHFSPFVLVASVTVHARRTRDAPPLCLSARELFHKFCPLQTRESVNLTVFANVPQSLPFLSPRQIFSVSAG